MGTERNKSVANARNEAALRAVKDQKMLEEARKKKEWDIRMAVAAETKKQELRVTALRAWQNNGGTEQEFDSNWESLYIDILRQKTVEQVSAPPKSTNLVL